MSLPSQLMLKEFHTRDHKYIYCSKSNQIFRVNPAMPEIIALYEQHSSQDILQQLSESFTSEDIADSYQTVDRLARQGGFFRSNGLSVRGDSASKDDICTELDRDIQQLCLEVSEGCNMRCHYCAYSGGYAHTRRHGTRSMPQNVARAAIDFILQKNQEREESFAISFYGGEPLTQTPLIKFCIQYARSLPWRHPQAPCFNLTTNGTLLDDDLIRFLIDNEVRLLVSLDGPAKDHDAHRVFAGGDGTFASVIANLRRFKEIAPEYQFVSISCVITPTSDLERMNDFFIQHRSLFKRLTLGNVVPEHQFFFREYPGDPDKQNQQFRTLYQQYVKAHLQPGPPIPERPEMTFIRPLFERNFLRLHRRHVLNQVPSQEKAVSTCFPGKRKVFVDVQGKLHVCERIVNTCSIGDVWAGFDLPVIKQLLDEYMALMNDSTCLNCWAFRFCPACFANMADDVHLSRERTNKLCSKTRKSLVETLRTYCAILEQNPQAFDYMDEYELA